MDPTVVMGQLLGLPRKVTGSIDHKLQIAASVPLHLASQEGLACNFSPTYLSGALGKKPHDGGVEPVTRGV